MKRRVTDSKDVADFWHRIDAIVVSRQRRFLAPYDDAPYDDAPDGAA
jgi:hypothetical protein